MSNRGPAPPRSRAYIPCPICGGADVSEETEGPKMMRFICPRWPSQGPWAHCWDCEAWWRADTFMEHLHPASDAVEPNPVAVAREAVRAALRSQHEPFCGAEHVDDDDDLEVAESCNCGVAEAQASARKWLAQADRALRSEK